MVKQGALGESINPVGELEGLILVILKHAETGSGGREKADFIPGSVFIGKLYGLLHIFGGEEVYPW